MALTKTENTKYKIKERQYNILQLLGLWQSTVSDEAKGSKSRPQLTYLIVFIN